MFIVTLVYNDVIFILIRKESLCRETFINFPAMLY